MKGSGSFWTRWGALALVLLAVAGCDRRRTASAEGKLSVWPGEIDFARVPMYGGGDRPITLRNIGRGGIGVDQVLIEGADAASYAAVFTQAGPQRLKPTETSELVVQFRPLREGPHTATITIRGDNPDEPPSVIPLVGVGVDAKAVVAPHALDFGRIEAQAQKTLQLTYRNISDLEAEVTNTFTGADADEFRIDSFRLQPFEERRVDVTFAPQRVGIKDTVLEVEPCRACPVVKVSIKAEALDRAIVAEPWELDFGQVPIDQDARRMARLHNISTEPVTLTGMGLEPNTDASFTAAIGLFPHVLGPDEVVEYEVRYAPGHMGLAEGRLDFEVQSVRNPKTLVPLRGWGGAAEICVSPTSHDFGTLPVGAKLAKWVNIKNCGSPNEPPLTITRIAWGGDGIPGEDQYGFEAPPAPITLAAGQETNVKVYYEPTREGDAGGYLHLYTSLTSAPHVRVGFNGRAQGAAECRLVVTPTEVDFGTVEPKRGAVLGVKVRNEGTQLCAVKNIRLRDDAGGVFTMPGGPIDGLLMYPNDFFSFMVAFIAPEGGGRFTGTLQIESADPANPVFLVPLRANSEPSCLVAEPRFVDFGDARPDCPPPPRTVNLSNACGQPITVNQVWIGPGTTDGEFQLDGVSPGAPVTLDPGESITVTVRYLAQVRGMNLSPLYADVTGLGAPLLVPLLGDSSDKMERTDSFIQQDGDKVDVLFVVDNTASMVEEHPRLIAAMPAFADAALAKGVDLHVAVTTTGINPASPACPGGAEGGEAGRLFPADNSNVRMMTQLTPNLGAELQQNVQVGQCANVEQGFEAMRRALSEPLVSQADDPRTPLPNDGNLGFLREEAALAVVFVGDEDDHSPDTVATYVQFLQAKKGTAQPQRAVIYAIAPTANACASAGGVGTRYAEAATRTGGAVLDICAGDFGPTLREVANKAFSPQDRFPLSARPDGSGFTVTVNGVQQPGGWSYDSASNSIVFTSLPPPGARIVVRYRIACS